MIYTINDLKVGDSFETKTLIEEKNVETFGHITKDLNPAHFDSEYASTTMLKKRIAHGMYVGSLYSRIFGMEFPGKGSIYLGQNLKFTAPVYFNDEITTKVTVKELFIEKNRVIFECVQTNQDGNIVIKGEAVIMPPKK
ncbi:MaoC family dehydratase [Candidatus Izimaplasma bacterium ZiA1]|uniref:MaoC family dehydratase n=1 Tax=Candidatus Izimoplasma sp. ZiA1 TaxID=2024899 RepID=UPI001F0A4C2A